MIRPTFLTRALVAGVASAALLAGCGDDDAAGNGPDADLGEDAATATQDVELSFAARFGDEVAACGESYEGVGTENSTVEITDLRFYVSAVHLVDADGVATAIDLDQESAWQHEGVALLDFTDGSGACEANPEQNDAVVGTIAEGDYSGVRFDLGIPFEQNHLDVDAADSPLNIPSMQWNWRNGYIFTSFELAVDSADLDGDWIIHVGSTGCGDGTPIEPPEEPCQNPNRATIELDDFDPTAGAIVFDLAALLADSDIEAEPAASGPGCQSFEEDGPECEPIFDNLGLSFDTGECVEDCAGQTAFSVE